MSHTMTTSLDVPYDAPLVCKRCRKLYVAGHICAYPQGTALERGIEQLRRGEVLAYDERAAVLEALNERP